MANNTIPTYLRNLDKSFMDLCNNGYYVDVSVAFKDVIEYGIQQFSTEPQKDVINEIKERYKGLEKVYEVFRQIILAIDSQMGDDWDWTDILGDYYEIIAGRSKKSGMGQFFTPKSICELSSKMTLPDKVDKDLKINDPTCGSGRMLLSGYVHLKGRAILYGEDLDPICTKMTALNMTLHGARGEVICHNSLNPTSFNFGYRINQVKGKSLGIERITAEQSEIVTQAKKRVNKAKKEEDKQQEKKQRGAGYQLKLFE